MKPIIYTMLIFIFAFSKFTFATTQSSSSMPSFFEVEDKKSLAQSLEMQQQTLSQWQKENDARLKQLQAQEDLLSFNEEDSKMPNKESWENINEIQENVMALMEANISLWEEFGDANKYYASFKKASAWQECFESGSCTFNQTINLLDDSSISFATKAYENAQQMQTKLKSELHNIANLTYEGENAVQRGALIDTLSKVNSQSAISLLDLNNQIATLVQLISHDLGSKNNVENIKKVETTNFLNSKNTTTNRRLLRIGE